jgi:hypothetical protein
MRLSSTLILFAAAWLPLTSCFADDGIEDDSRRFNFGARADFIALKQFDTQTQTGSTTQPIADYTYSGSSTSSHYAGGPVFEMRLRKHIWLGAELSFHHASYAQVTDIRTGLADPNLGTDNRPLTILTDNTTANYWDIPILVRFRGLRESGRLKRFYPLVGGTYRHVGRVRTGNDTVNADGSTDYNEIPDVPVHRNLFGFTAGIGFRLVDELGIKVVPEIRFTRWFSDTFNGLSYTSSPNQAQAGIGITF